MGAIRIRVGVLISGSEGILLVRHEKAGRSYWLLPGGGAEYGESLADTARRELREETGLEVDIDDLALLWETLAPDGSRHVVNLCFAARVTGGTLRVGTDDERVREVRYVPLAGLAELPMHPPLAEPIARYLADGGRPLVLGPIWTDDGRSAQWGASPPDRFA